MFQRFAFSLVSIITVLGLTACSAENDPDAGAKENSVNVSGESEATFAGKVPDFTGPYASLMAAAYQESLSDLTRQILQDEKITESEYAEVQQADKECLEGLGFKNVEHFPQGGKSVDPPNTEMDQKQAEEQVKSCSDSSGLTDIEPLFDAIKTNPNNEDWDDLYVACLIREGVVEPGFTKEDLDQWFTTDDPMLRSGIEVKRCFNDPLGLLDGSVQ